MSISKTLFIFLMFLLMVLVGPAQSLAQPVLTSGTETSRTGHFQLEWEYSEADAKFVLQQADNPAFRNAITIYQGPDRARTLSGQLNGTYYFRIRAEGSHWSEPIVVKVEHYELSTAFMFLGMGALVFLATASLVIRGHLKYRNSQGENE